ncbi:MAG TPA: hypothetical protein VNT75_19225 [Symbiobacteriaceae bacterium]|nr:hypothetical protein [Symbiobacteriaceae bacterium]
MVNVIHGSSGGLQCVTGQVTLFPQTGIGATNGVVLVQGHTIRIRQVPGPNNAGVPLSSVDGQTALLCGNFLVDGGQVILNVQTVRPLLQ